MLLCIAFNFQRGIHIYRRIICMYVFLYLVLGNFPLFSAASIGNVHHSLQIAAKCFLIVADYIVQCMCSVVVCYCCCSFHALLMCRSDNNSFTAFFSFYQQLRTDSFTSHSVSQSVISACCILTQHCFHSNASDFF